MAKKSKEIEFAGYRIQIDPLILVRRILTRQKLLLALVAILGGAATAAYYKMTPKQYTSNSNILIRAENFQEDYIRKFLNVVAQYIGSNTEMMIIINELNLYAPTRASLPYEMALTNMRRELKIDRGASNIAISFKSKSPPEAQRVVAFVTERVLTKLADLKDSPYRQQLEAIGQAVQELKPQVAEAQQAMYEFKESHPEIAAKQPEQAEAGSPLAAVDEEIETAQRQMKACGTTPAAEPAPKPKKKTGPACAGVARVEAEREELLGKFTPNHPTVIAKDAELRKQKALCEKEQGEDDDEGSTIRPGLSLTECIAAYSAKIKRLNERKSELVKKLGGNPRLRAKWNELVGEVNLLDNRLYALKETEQRTIKERLIAANEFKDAFVLVDIPQVPELPSSPDRNQFLAFGMAITFIVGMVLAVGREALRQNFVDARELEEQTGLTVLAVLPSMADDSSK